MNWFGNKKEVLKEFFEVFWLCDYNYYIWVKLSVYYIVELFE